MNYPDMLISEETTVLDTLKVLDKTAKGVLFITRDGQLVAAVSDGDIRRWLLKQGSLNDPISKCANYQPKSITENERDRAYFYLQRDTIKALPVVDSNNRVIDILFAFDNIKKTKKQIDIPVVIMAGGKGTRLYPYTKILPKPLIPIGDIPISEHIVNRFHEAGCNDFYFIVNYRKNMIKAYFNEIEKDYSVSFVDEDKPLGTGGGVRLLKNLVDSTFILTNCDTIVDDDFSEMLKAHQDHHNLVTMICSLRNYEVPYGVVELGDNGTIESLTEKPSMSFFTNTGTYIVEPEVIDYIEPDTNVGFPDVIMKLKENGENVGVFPINENAWLDMGQFDTMENMKQRLHVKD